MTGSIYGYARVSSKDQNLNRQIDALAQFGIPRSMLFADKASGKDFDRPAYKQMLEKLQEGDVVVIKSIDRLGRNYEEILEEWRSITKTQKASIIVLDMPLLNTQDKTNELTSILVSEIVLQLLSYVAQIEREQIKQRQAEGIAAAQARGVKFGRPKKERPSYYKSVKSAYLKRAITRQEAAKKLNVSPSTLSRWIKEDDK